MENCCENCAKLNRSYVKYNKENKTYMYGCGRSMHENKRLYIPSWCTDDSDLGMIGCGHFVSRKKMILKVGDCVQFQKFKVKVRYMYCGMVQGKRLLYGGKIVNGTVDSCRFILVPDDFCRIIKRDKESCIFMSDRKYAEKRKDEFMRMERLRR